MFTETQLAHGLVKRMNGFAFCHSGDQELVDRGYMKKKFDRLGNTLKPYVTSDGKRFLMEVLEKYRKEEDEEIERNKPTYCEYCGCIRAKYLGDLEHHKGDCQNIPF